MAEQPNPEAEMDLSEPVSGRNRFDFLRIALQNCFAFVVIAETQIGLIGTDRAETCIAHAEHGYATLVRFLSDPTYARFIASNERGELSAGMARLRARLDNFVPR
jgi:hypothetical protein